MYNALILSLLILSLVAPVVFYQAPEGYAATSTGVYRVPITITERSGNELTNYSVLINVDLREAIFWGKARVDLADLRFTDEAGSEIPLWFWIESFANTSMIYDYSTNVGTTKEIITYAVVGDRIYGSNSIPTPTRIWVYYLNNGTLEVLYSDASKRFTLWQGLYNESEGKVYAVGQYSDGTYMRSAVFVIDVINNTVTYERHPNTGDVNEFIGVDEYGDYLFVGERNRNGYTDGSSYTNGGGVWKIPKSTITDYTTWERIWEDPYGREIRAIKVYRGSLYVLAVPSEGYGTNVTLYKYNESADTFDEVTTFTEVEASLDFQSFMDDGTYLYIAISNSTTGTIHIYAYDGKSVVEEFDTGIPNYHTVRILATKIHGEDVIFLGTDRGDIYAIVWSSKRVLKLGTIPMMHYGYGGRSRATFNKYTFDLESLTLYPTEAYDTCRLYSIEYGNVEVWVKIPYIPANGQVTIYMYYGGESTYLEYNNPYKTFLFFDDFSQDTSANYTKTPVYYGSEADYTISWDSTEKALKLEVIGNRGGMTIKVPCQVNGKFAIRTRARYFCADIDNQQVGIGVQDSNYQRFFRGVRAPRYNVERLDIVEKVSSGETILAEYSMKVDADYHTYELRYNGTQLKGIFDDQITITASVSLSFPQDVLLYVYGEESNDGALFDYIIVRKYTDPEPTVSIGSEVLVSEEGAYMYRIPITITEQSGNDLTNYSVRIVLNETNFPYWNHIATTDGSDIYFTDAGGSPLYYWIENFDPINKTATIWVNVTSIPANSNITIYMYYGGDNPYSSYNDPEQVFDFYDDFEDLSNWTEVKDGNSYIAVNNSLLEIHNDGSNRAYARSNQQFSAPYVLEVKAKMVYSMQIEIHWDGVFSGKTDAIYNGYDCPIFAKWRSPTYLQIAKWVDGSATVLSDYQYSLNTEWHIYKILAKTNGIEVYLDGSKILETTDTTFTSGYIGLSGVELDSGIVAYYDWVRIRKYTEPEPTFSIGTEELIEIGIELPSESLYLIHNITYMPNATQFTHTFSAVNNSTADYILGTPDEYGWAVYANPFDNTENNATLISEITINLPYSEVIVENVTLYAKINGTGNYSQLWVKVLNSTGGVVAELINSSLDTNWTKFVIPISANLSNQIKLWINATVESTNTIGEELAIKNVRVSIGYETNPVMRVTPISNVKYFNASATHTVELGSTEYINSSVITFKLIEHLIFNGTDYPVQPIFIGNETIGSYNYSVYRISPASYSQALKIYALIENRLRPMRVLSKGVEVETALVGENITIELPDIARIHIVEINKTYENVSRVSLEFYEVGVYTIKANITEPSMWKLGSVLKTIVVKYGQFTARTLDIESKEIDYEELTFELINKTDGQIIRQLVGNKRFELTGLWAGNYTLRVKFKDIVVAVKDFELSTLTDGSVVNLTCPMKKLPADYRGFARTIITNYDKEIVNVTNISTKFPYSRMSILLNGTGAFKLYVNYQGDLPTDINVTANNVTNLTYYWDGNYLVIEGSLGSLGIINITDLYKVRLELYDRLGHPMPEWIYVYINETQYFGSVIEDYLYPEDYVLELPETIYGFEFYSYFDGYNETVRNITINNTDVLYKVWYRIPTKIEPVKAFQVTASWFERLLKPFISSDENTTKVYIEGYLRDYYDNGVPNRPLIVNITDVQANLTWSVNTTTDLSGYFRTPLLDLIRGRTYEIKIIYSGDSIYVGTLTTTEFTPETLPEAPAPITEIIPINYIILGIGALVIVGAIVGIIRAIKHTIEDIRETKRFIRRRR